MDSGPRIRGMISVCFLSSSFFFKSEVGWYVISCKTGNLYPLFILEAVSHFHTVPQIFETLSC